MCSPVAVIVRSILNHDEIEHNPKDQSNEVDHQARENHKSRVSRAGAPGPMGSAGFPVANIHVCESYRWVGDEY